MNEAEQNSKTIKDFFEQKLAALERDGVIGVAKFQNVYNELMPSQKAKLEQICGERFQDFLEKGSIICIGIAYPEFAIESIDSTLSNGTVDKAAWNIYAREYHTLNRILEAVAQDIANTFGGIVIPPITGSTVKTVEDYYGQTISHRVVAENAGLGWRGKNELLVNERLSCALRFASILTCLPLTHGKRLNESCQDCTACIESCTILKNKTALQNYRENCRKYITHLALEADVCGKCIKACHQHRKSQIQPQIAP